MCIRDREEALELAKKDLISFGKLFLPDDFMRSETPAFHYEVADKINDLENKQVAIILPRGHGKTVLTKASIVHDFCFATKEDPLFYGWVSATQKLSAGNMDYVKYHLEFNEKIMYFFGTQKGRKWTDPSGNDKYFNTLQAWRLSPVSSGIEPLDSTKPNSRPSAETIGNSFSEDDDLPF